MKFLLFSFSLRYCSFSLFLKIFAFFHLFPISLLFYLSFFYLLYQYIYYYLAIIPSLFNLLIIMMLRRLWGIYFYSKAKRIAENILNILFYFQDKKIILIKSDCEFSLSSEYWHNRVYFRVTIPFTRKSPLDIALYCNMIGLHHLISKGVIFEI